MVTPDRDTPQIDEDLEAFFAAGRAVRVDPSEALMARVLADAEAAQAGVSVTQAAPARRGLWAAVAGAVGGWPALAGLASAAVAGLWVGVAVPEAGAFVGLPVIGDTAALESGYDLSDLGLSGLALSEEF